MTRELQYSHYAVGCIVVLTSLTGLLYGYDIGCTSAALAQLTHPISGVTWFTILSDSVYYRGLVASASLLGAFLSASFVCISTPFYSSSHFLLAAR
jgi:hypothetical protein